MADDLLIKVAEAIDPTHEQRGWWRRNQIEVWDFEEDDDTAGEVDVRVSYQPTHAMPRFTTDLNAAWSLASEILDAGWDFCLDAARPGVYRIDAQDERGHELIARAATPAEAICRAYLMWKESQDG